MTNVSLNDQISVHWVKQNTEVNLPDPFFDVIISIKKHGERLEKLALHINGKEIVFNNTLLSGITNISEPDITYSRSEYSKDKRIKSFNIYFEYGSPKLIDLGNDIPGCKIPCVETVRDVVVFTINQDYEISRELKSINKK